MTILDHRILIPKSPEKIWGFLSDISQNTAWQTDCKTISILTTKHTGTGVRWRYTTGGGNAYVVEITAWYDGLGYEYTFVDGAPFRESKGRIRLQEIAEGTVVQWTFTYETNGVFAGFRNAVGLKRQFENAMIDSLKTLWKVLQKAVPEDKPREVKSLMRDAPDYESRIQYRPRHPSVVSESVEPSFITSIVEPPIAADDTRPRAPVVVESSSSEYVVPEADKSVDNPDTGVIEPVVYSPPVAKQTEARDFIPRPALENPTLDPVPESARRATQEIQAITLPQESSTPAELPGTDRLPNEHQPIALSTSVPDTVKMATAEMSVFELFGLPRPSQTQESSRISISESVANPISVAVNEPSQKLRMGLRLVLRRKRVAVRRPT